MKQVIVHLLLLLFLQSFIYCRPVFTPLFGLNLNDGVKREGNRVTHSFQHIFPNGRYLTLDYDVEHADGIFHLDSDLDVEAVVCSPRGINLTLSPGVIPEQKLKQVQAFSFITGSRQWGCDKTIQAKIRRAYVSSSSSLFVDLTTCVHADFVRNANVEFRLNHFQNASAYTFSRPPSTKGSTSTIQKRGFFSWFVSNVVDPIKNLGEDVWKIARDAVGIVTKVISWVITGDVAFSVSPSDMIAFNYNATTQSAISSDIALDEIFNCENCYAYLDTELYVSLNITNYSLVNATAALIGSAEFDINLVGTVSTSYSYDSNYTVTTIQLPAVELPIGPLLLYIDVVVPVVVGFSADLSAAASISVQSHATGQFELGASVLAGGTYMPISSHDFSYAGQIAQLQGEATITAEVFVLPSIVIDIDHIGGPVIGVKPYIQFEVSSAAETGNAIQGTCDSSSTTSGSDVSVQVSLSWGIQVTLGAQILIYIVDPSDPLFSYVITSKTVYSLTRSIVSGCGVLSSAANGTESESGTMTLQTIDSSVITNKAIWTGFLSVPNGAYCENSPAQGIIAVQYLTYENDIYFVIQESRVYDTPIEYTCVVHALYGLNTTQGQLVINPVMDPNNPGYGIGYFSCDNQDFSPVLAYNYTVNFQADSTGNSRGVMQLTSECWAGQACLVGSSQNNCNFENYY